jgi:hypothetical protein
MGDEGNLSFNFLTNCSIDVDNIGILYIYYLNINERIS